MAHFRFPLALTLAIAGICSAGQPTADLMLDRRPAAANVIIPQARSFRAPDRAQGVILERVEASIDIVNQIATTTLTLHLTNPTRSMQEAELIVPVPDGALMKSFRLEGLGEEGYAKVLPREDARRIYNDIVRQIKDPGLVEFIGFNLIRTSVFPVAPGGTQVAHIAFEQVIPQEAGRMDYVLPRTQSLEESAAWSLKATVQTGSDIATVYSPSHDIVTERVGAKKVVVRVPDGASATAGAFRLSALLQPAGAESLPASLYAYPDPSVADGRGGYFLLLAGLPPVAPEDRATIKREVIVVLDRSGSMRGEKLEQAREAALQVIEGLDEGEFFNILDYSDSINMLSARPMAKNSKSVAAARMYLRSIKASGGTNIHDAVVESLRQETNDGSLPMVLFLTDGLPTIGKMKETEIREAARLANTHDRRIFTFGVGYDVNAPLLNHIATTSRATSTFVLPEEDVEVKVAQVFRRLSGPALAHPKVIALDSGGNHITTSVRELMPGELADVFEGEQVVLLGQYTNEDRLRLRISGNYFGRERTFDYDFDLSDATTRHAFVPRLWASRKIAMLIDQIRQSGADSGIAVEPRPGEVVASDPAMQELIDEIVRLSTQWGILTEYTAFLAAEPEQLGEFAARLGLRGLSGAGSRDGMSVPEAETVAGAALRERAVNARAGQGAVNQAINLEDMRQNATVGRLNSYVDANMKRVDVRGVRQVADQTLFRRGQRWVDSRLLAEAEPEVDETIEFGTDRYIELAERFARESRQALLAQRGDLLLLLDGRRVLIRQPG